MTRPLIIGVSGGSGSGKTTLARKIQSALGIANCFILSQDNYYFDQSAKFDGDGGQVNFDHPSSLDFDFMAEHLVALKKSESVNVPVYDFKTHSRLPETTKLNPPAVIILDGILIYSQSQIRPLLDIQIFVDIPEDVRFQRRLKRDIEERGRTQEGVTKQWFAQVKPMHDMFVEPSKAFADYIVNDSFNVSAFVEKMRSENIQ